MVTFDPVNCGFLSVDEVSVNDIKIFPNPTSGQVTLSNNIDYSQVNVYSIEGKLILNKSLVVGDNNLSLNLNSGLYLLEFEGSNTKSTQKLIVQ